MPRHLKTVLSDDAKADADAKVRRTVEEVLADIETRAPGRSARPGRAGRPAPAASR